MPDVVAGAASPFTAASSSRSQSAEILEQRSKEFVLFFKGLFSQRSQKICELLAIKVPLLWTE